MRKIGDIVCVVIITCTIVICLVELGRLGRTEAHELPPDRPAHKHWWELTEAEKLGPDGKPWTGDEPKQHIDSPGYGASADGGDIGPRVPIPLKVRHVEFTTSDFITLRALLDAYTPIYRAQRAEAEAAKEGFVTR